MAFFFPLGLTAYLKERMDFLLYSKIAVVFSLIAGIYGMKLFGVMGVVLASLLGNLLKNFFLLFFMRKYPEIKYRFKDYLNYIYILIFLTPFSVFHYIQLNIYLLLISSLFFFIYSGFIFIIYHPFSKYDMELLSKLADSSNALKKSKNIFLKCYKLIPRFLILHKKI